MYEIFKIVVEVAFVIVVIISIISAVKKGKNSSEFMEKF